MYNLKSLSSILALNIVLQISSPAFAMDPTGLKDDWKGAAPLAKPKGKEPELPAAEKPQTAAAAGVGAVSTASQAASQKDLLSLLSLGGGASAAYTGKAAAGAGAGGAAAAGAGAGASQFKSTIFTYADPEEATGLKVYLQGKGWYARNVTEADIEFHQALFSDPKIMAGFADGQPRDPKVTEWRIRNQWLPRFAAGQPHGGLTVFDDKGERIGNAVAGGGDGPGACEIARALRLQRKGVGSGLLDIFVNIWGPEVRAIGLGKGLDEIQDAQIIKAFQCFGGKALARFDVTSSPSNLPSVITQDKAGFLAAISGVSEENLKNFIDFDGKELSPAALEEDLLKLFDASASDAPLKVGIRYRLVDPQGKVRTFSKHKDYNRIKFHLERQVN